MSDHVKEGIQNMQLLYLPASMEISDIRGPYVPLFGTFRCPCPRPVKADLQDFILNQCCKVPNNCFVNSLCFLLNIKILQDQFFLQQYI